MRFAMITHTIPIPGKKDSTTKIDYLDYVILYFQMDGHLEVTNGDAFKPELTKSDVKKGKGTKMQAIKKTTVTIDFTEHGKHHQDLIIIK
jgi:hypothetical protein